MDIERNKVLGDCLRKLRKKAGLTQTELAARMHKTQSYVSKVENAERSLPLVETFLYAEALDSDYTILASEVYGGLSEAGLDQHVGATSLERDTASSAPSGVA